MTNTTKMRRQRGRPKTTDADRMNMRAKIEATALHLFQTEGYDSISMRRLASEIGCSPMTLYAHFQSKIDILRAVWDQVFDDLFEQLAPLVRATDEAGVRLNRLACGYVEYWLSHPDIYRMVFMSAGVSQTDVNVFLNGSAASERLAAFRVALATACPRNTPPRDLEEKGDILLSALHGIAHCQITMSGYPWTPAKTQVKRLLQLLTEN